MGLLPVRFYKWKPVLGDKLLGINTRRDLGVLLGLLRFYNWKPVLGDKLVGISTRRDFGDSHGVITFFFYNWKTVLGDKLLGISTGSGLTQNDRKVSLVLQNG